MGAVNRAAAAGGSIAAVLGAASIAAVNLPQYEGWVLTGYGDPMQGSKLATACAGVTKGIELGKKYTEEDCQSRTAQALVEHGMGIAKCLPDSLPPLTRAAYTDLAYNIGVGQVDDHQHGFCGSKTAQYARAGNLRASCQAIQNLCKQCAILPGIKKRREYETDLCLKGLKGTAA